MLFILKNQDGIEGKTISPLADYPTVHTDNETIQSHSTRYHTKLKKEENREEERDRMSMKSTLLPLNGFFFTAIISPNETCWQRQYFGSFGSTGKSIGGLMRPLDSLQSRERNKRYTRLFSLSPTLSYTLSFPRLLPFVAVAAAVDEEDADALMAIPPSPPAAPALDCPAADDEAETEIPPPFLLPLFPFSFRGVFPVVVVVVVLVAAAAAAKEEEADAEVLELILDDEDAAAVFV